MRTNITILEETEEAGAWLFRARIGSEEERTMRLSWQDYEDWSSGRLPPARVAQAVLTALIEHHDTAELAEVFDAARYRRQIASFDEDVRRALGSAE